MSHAAFQYFCITVQSGDRNHMIIDQGKFVINNEGLATMGKGN